MSLIKIFMVCLSIFISTLLIIGSLHATTFTFTVTKTEDAVDNNPGDTICDDGTGNCTLRAAVTESNMNPGKDAIEIPAGTYLLDIDDNAAGDDANAKGDLDITEEVTINGDSGGGTIIDGGNGILSTPDRVFDILSTSGTFEINNVTIRNGAESLGGGIHNESDTNMTINKCSFLNNDATSDGGGFYYSTINGILTLTNSTFTGNTTTNSGGGFSLTTSVGDSSVDGCVFTDNIADTFDGGGFYYDGENLSVTNSTFYSNEAGRDGGGLYFWGAYLVIETTTVDDNTASQFGGGIFSNSESTEIGQSTASNNESTSGDGGGVYVYANPDALTMVNSTVSGNTTAGDGGGIWADSKTLATLTNVTIVKNSASATTGGGIFNDGTAGSIILKNSIVANNTSGGDCSGITSDGNNISSDTTCFDTTDSTDSPDTDPLLADLADTGGPTKTHAPLANSPAIDNADAGAAPTKDQRGVDRDANPDIGAHEANCGDGVAQGVEECDNGSSNSDTEVDACRTDCTEAACGDNVVDTDEECDDGKTVGGDGCSASCETEDGGGCSLMANTGHAPIASAWITLIAMAGLAVRRKA